ncbi:MAG: hypothetical protein AABY22_19860 [Nanoarchaeota archaeon]
MVGIIVAILAFSVVQTISEIIIPAPGGGFVGCCVGRRCIETNPDGCTALDGMPLAADCSAGDVATCGAAAPAGPLVPGAVVDPGVDPLVPPIFACCFLKPAPPFFLCLNASQSQCQNAGGVHVPDGNCNNIPSPCVPPE